MDKNIKTLKGLLVKKHQAIDKKINYLSLLTDNEEEYYINLKNHKEMIKLLNSFIYLKVKCKNKHIEKIFEHKIIDKL